MIGGLFSLLLTSVLSQASAQAGATDPAFQKIPFDEWLSEGGRPAIRCGVAVGSVSLSFHQRLLATFSVKVDGRDLEARRQGQLIFFVQVKDAAGTQYQNHGSVELAKLDEKTKSIDLEFQSRAFILPGEYELAAAILDTATGEHTARRIRFRTGPPKVDFLPAAWRSLPAVEFVGDAEPPDSWYLPRVSGRLQWAAGVHSPVRLTIVLNVAPPPPDRAPGQTESAELAGLIPTLRSLTETGSATISERVEVLDLARRRTAFAQDDVHQLDWPRLKAGLAEANTASIDLHSLSQRHEDAQFFVRSVRKLLSASQPPCVLVILSPPVAFESGENLQPISTEGLPACRAFYVRYRAARQVRPPGSGFETPQPRRRPLGRMPGPVFREPRPSFAFDQLEATLKPLGPKVLDVETPLQMTRLFVDIERSFSSESRAAP